MTNRSSFVPVNSLRKSVPRSPISGLPFALKNQAFSPNYNLKANKLESLNVSFIGGAHDDQLERMSQRGTQMGSALQKRTRERSRVN